MPHPHRRSHSTRLPRKPLLLRTTTAQKYGLPRGHARAARARPADVPRAQPAGYNAQPVREPRVAESDARVLRGPVLGERRGPDDRRAGRGSDPAHPHVRHRAVDADASKSGRSTGGPPSAAVSLLAVCRRHPSRARCRRAGDAWPCCRLCRRLYSRLTVELLRGPRALRCSVPCFHPAQCTKSPPIARSAKAHAR